MKPSGIGGQAVIEGVMMKNQDVYAVAVRKPNKEIEIKNEEYHSIQKKYPFLKLPILRGIVSFVESMVIGMKTLTYSASFYEEEEAPSKVEEKMGKIFKEKAEAVVMGITVCVSILLAVAIFMILPFFIAEFLKKIIDNANILAIIEGIIRITIFIAYVVAISFMEDIKRVFMYHGAEHKTINCVENGLELTVKNVRKQSKHHKRCGTSFLFVVMFFSIIFFIFIKFDNIWLRMVGRILLVPIIAGVSYEFIRLAGRSESKIMDILSKPGMWLQKLTTKEPDDSMIEVAIASVEAVFDWKKYQEEEKEAEEAYRKAEEELAIVAQVVDKNIQQERQQETQKNKQKTKSNSSQAVKQKTKADSSQAVKQEEKVDSSKLSKKQGDTKEQEEIKTQNVRVAKKAENSRLVMGARLAREKAMAEEESSHSSINMLDEEEDDEILRALDKFFVYDQENKES